MRGIQDAFAQETGCSIEGTFSAVGEMRDQLLAGAECDLVILTQALIAQLIASGHVVAGSARSLGLVHTGIAVRRGDAPAARQAVVAQKLEGKTHRRNRQQSP